MKFLKNFKHLFFLFIALNMVVTGCKKAELGNFSDDYLYSLTEIVKQDTAYSSFLKIMSVDKTVNGALNGVNPYGNGYTLFLPTNSAVNAFLKDDPIHNTLDELLLDTSYIVSLVRFHVLSNQYKTTDFPYGVIPDTTTSGDNVSVYYMENEIDNGESYYIVQNQGIITEANVQARNGYIHVIDRMLTPVVYSSYIALKQTPGYTIFVEGLEKTGLTSKMDLNLIINDYPIRNRYTTFAEPDSMYANYSISSFDELVRYIYTRAGAPQDYDYSSDDFTSESSIVYQYFAYHLTEQALFTSSLVPSDEDQANNKSKTKILNSFGNSGIETWSNGDIIKVNRGSGDYGTQINGNDTVSVNWVGFDIVNSNAVSKNGPIHKLTQLLFPYDPPASNVLLQLDDDPILFRQLASEGNWGYPVEYLTRWELKGVEALFYSYSKSSEPAKYANAYNFIKLRGAFEATYTTPRILAGTYSIQVRIHANSSKNSTVQFYLDGEKIGSVIDPTSSEYATATSPFVTFSGLATVRFNKYETHKITVKSITSGTLMWDFVQFVAYN